VNIPFEGTYTPDQLIRFDRASRKALGSSGIYTYAGCSAIAAIVLFILGLFQWRAGNESGALQWLALFLIAAVLAPMYRWSARRSYARHPNANQRVSGVLLDNEFEIRTSTTESKVAWDGIASSFCAPDYLILISPTAGLYGLSADFFRTPGDFTSACEFVLTRVPGKPPGQSPRKRLFRALGWVVLAVLAFLVWSLMRPSA
jgi:hypothetical protein